jgi:hypothetical protein
MKICGTNLIPIFLTIVLCGAIFVFLNMRLAEVKSSVEKQNRVLTSFITNVQMDIKNGGMMMGASGMGASSTGASASSTGASAGPVAPKISVGANHLASEEALQVVKRNEKIIVSDDEYDDESESESDTDDESNTSSDSEDEQENDDGIKIISLSNDCVNLELISDNLKLDLDELPTLQESSLQESSLQEHTTLQESSLQEHTTLEESSLQESSLQESSLQESITLEEHIPQTTTESGDVLKIIELDSSADVSKQQDINYEQMKVDDLRKIVTDMNLAVKDEVRKLKKPELLALLKK